MIIHDITRLTALLILSDICLTEECRFLFFYLIGRRGRRLRPDVPISGRIYMEITEVIKKAYAAGASDVHLLFGRPVMLRINGTMSAYGTEVL